MRTLRRLLRPFWNPIVEKELRSRMRTGRASLLISLYLLTLAAVGWFTYVVVRRQATAGVTGGQLGVHAGTTIFRALTVWELVLVLFVAPALTAAAIAGERERQTLDLLLCTRVRPSTIVIGKLVASLLFAVLLLLASVPVFSTVFLFGGVELSQVVGVAAILAITAVVIGALGLLCSAGLRRPTGATVFAYIVAFLYLVVPLGTSVIFPTSVTSKTAQAYAEFANPVFALGSTLMDTPIRSPIGSRTSAPPRTSSLYSSGPTGMSCTVTANGTACSSIVGSAPLVSSAPAPIPQNDQIGAGLFKGWRAWQGFAASNAVVVAVLVGIAIAALPGKQARIPRRRRRRRQELPAQ